MKFRILHVVSLAIGIFATAVLPSGAQDSFPTGPITMVVPFPAGGNADTVARLVAEHASGTLGQPMVVDNRPGGSGMVAANYVLQREADGHTIYLATDGQYAVNSNQLEEGAEDPMDSFVAISQLVNGPLVIAASPQLEVETLADVITMAKEGKELTYGANSKTSAHFIISKILQDRAGIEMRHIPYRGTAATIPDLVAGRIDLVFGQSTSLAEQQSQGVKLLALTAASGMDELPDVPSVAETIDGFDFSVAYGLFAPLGTPDATVAKLNEAVRQALESDKVAAAIRSSGAVPAPGTPEAFGKFVEGKRAAFKEVMAGLDLSE